MNKPRFQKRTLFLFAYLLFALLPIYWMLNMSFKTNEEIVSSFSLWPQDFTLANYITIFTDELLSRRAATVSSSTMRIRLLHPIRCATCAHTLVGCVNLAYLLIWTLWWLVRLSSLISISC